MPPSHAPEQTRALPLDSLATTGRPQEIVLLGASLSHLEFLAQLLIGGGAYYFLRSKSSRAHVAAGN